MNNIKNILVIKNLVTAIEIEERGFVQALRGISFSIKRGEVVGLVGESGSGKSLVALSIMRLLPKPACKIESGHILYEGEDLVQVTPEKMRSLRGRKIAMIFQEPMTALNPVKTIGSQLSEAFTIHIPSMSKKEIFEESVNLMSEVGISDPEHRLKEYPHQLSGGMRQRIMIAMALSCKPDILIADEPTSSLDATIQEQILSLMKDIQKKYRMAIIFISHDFSVVSEMCDKICVMYGGLIVEEATTIELFKNPQHPYTKGLLKAIPRLESVPKSQMNTIEGVVPSLIDMPLGCPFANRCSVVLKECYEKLPEMSGSDDAHEVRCFNWR